MAKELKARIVLKNDTRENWNKSSFIPKPGEPILVIDESFPLRIGDGTTMAKDLPAEEVTWGELKDRPDIEVADWDKIVNKPESYPTNWGNINDKPDIEVAVWSKITGKPDIKVGTGENAIVIGDGAANGDYSVAGGTTDGDALKDMTGSIITPTLTPAQADGAMSLAFGANNRTNSTGALSIGYATKAGAKGYYYRAINFTNKTIELSTNRTFLKAPSSVTWKSGDKISLVCNHKYPYSCTITNVNGAVITVDTLPFTEDQYHEAYYKKILGSWIENALAYTMPDDRTILNVTQPEAGEIELAWGAVAIGSENTATGAFSVAHGWKNIVAGDFGAATGRDNIVGYASESSGWGNTVTGKQSHTEGYSNTVTAANGHAEGSTNTVSKQGGHAEGWSNTVNGEFGHAEGGTNTINGNYSHAEGSDNIVDSKQSHVEGKQNTINANARRSHAEGAYNVVGGDTKPTTFSSSRDGEYSADLPGQHAHAEGHANIAYGPRSHAEGDNNLAIGESSHAEGQSTKAEEESSHAEGQNTVASGQSSHAEGSHSIASGTGAHAEGYGYEDETTESGWIYSEASGVGSHAEGVSKALGDYSHAEGNNNTVETNHGHAEGLDNNLNKDYKKNITKIIGVNDPGLSWTSNGTSTFYTYVSNELSSCDAVEDISIKFLDGRDFGAKRYTYEVRDLAWQAQNGETSPGKLAWRMYPVNFGMEYSNYAHLVDARATAEQKKEIFTLTYTVIYESHINTTGGHVEGAFNISSGSENAHVEGISNSAFGAEGAHIEGYKNIVEGCTYSHAEGEFNKIEENGSYGHIEGCYNTVSNIAAHAEGDHTTASGENSHSEGKYSVASGSYSHAEGVATRADAEGAHAEGCGSVDKDGIITYSQASGRGSHVEGIGTMASGEGAHGEGRSNVVQTEYGHVEGYNNKLNQIYSGVKETVISNYKIAINSNEIVYSTTNGTENFELVISSLPQNGNVSNISIKLLAPTDLGLDESNGTWSSFEQIYVPAIEDGDMNPPARINFKIDSDHSNGFYMDAVNQYATEEQKARAFIVGYTVTENVSSSIALGGHIEGESNISAGSTNSHIEGYKNKLNSAVGSHVEGLSNTAENCEYPHAEGGTNYIQGNYSHVEGSDNKVYVKQSHAEGKANVLNATARRSHAEGAYNIVGGDTMPTTWIADANDDPERNDSLYGQHAHAEGHANIAFGARSHAEGDRNVAGGVKSHVEGTFNLAFAPQSHAEGYENTIQAEATGGHVEGYKNKLESGIYSHAEGGTNTITKEYSHAEGSDNKVYAKQAHAEGKQNTVNAMRSHAEGGYNTIETGGDYGHVEGYSNTVSGNSSHAEGGETKASGRYSHAEGGYSVASGAGSHAEGYGWDDGTESNTFVGSIASGEGSHAEGHSTASGDYSHSEGISSVASGAYSHAEGRGTTASGDDSHAEGNGATASGGNGAHAEGFSTTASGDGAHAEGDHTIAEGTYSHVQGQYNVIDTENRYAHIVGNGESNLERSNAHTLDWDGNTWYAGNIRTGGTGYDDGIDLVGLPPVTADDDGKILRVVGGKWAAVEITVYNGEVVE